MLVELTNEEAFAILSAIDAERFVYIMSLRAPKVSEELSNKWIKKMCECEALMDSLRLRFFTSKNTEEEK